MPTDLSCTTCKGTGIDPACEHPRHEHDNCPLCPDCGGSGIAGWAVEAAAKTLRGRSPLPWDGLIQTDRDLWRRKAMAVLAAVREEAKNQ